MLLSAIAIEIFSMVYVGTATWLLNAWAYTLDASSAFIVVHFCTASDLGGIFFGSALGKEKTMHFISDAKTKAGLVGCIALPIIITTPLHYAIAHFTEGKFSFHMSFCEYLILGVIIGALAVFGDAVESFMKRASKMKDSSDLLPGHGGLLDRLDSTMFSWVFIAWLSMVRARHEQNPPDVNYQTMFLKYFN